MPHETPKASLSDIGFGAAISSMFGGDAGKSPTHAKVSRKRGLRAKLSLPTLLPALLLLAYGLLTVWSASLTIAEASLPRQLVGALMGLAGATVLWHYDYRALANYTNVLLGVAVFLILMPKIPGLGITAKGMTGWVKIPLIGFRFQPSEPCKIVVIFLMASIVAQYNGKIDTFRDYARLCGTLLVPLLLILTQDLGTGLVIFFSGALIIVCGGAPMRWVLPTVGLIVAAATLVIFCSMTEGLPNILKPYQLKRLIVFVDPSVDPTGDGYNLQQAQIAVGSGGLLGKGLGKATQAGQGFLPEAHTDFIFALLSEEFGFAGAFLLLLLFGWLLLATIMLALRTDSPFGRLCLVGVVAMWSFQLLENVGMCLGIMPITGIPLPFISFGSSSLITQLAAVGIVQSVYHHRTKSA